MDTIERYLKVSQLIASRISGTINSDEEKILSEWLNEDDYHLTIYNNIVERIEQRDSYLNHESVHEDWLKVKNRIVKNDKPRLSVIPFYRYAAVAILLVVLPLAFIFISKNKASHVIVVEQMPEVDEIQPGAARAILTFASGEKVVLEDLSENNIEGDGVLIEKSEGRLSYKDSAKELPEEKEMLNTINIPNGGEYQLTLSDGTEVYLNSGSELTFPVKFLGKNRIVYVKGEAYFEVAKNEHMPFIVKTINDMEVKVLGTHFNITAYEEDETIETTLAEGRVEVSNGKESVALLPNQQAVFEKNNQQMSVRKVDAGIYTAWRNGKFIFENKSLEYIMERLRRWYNIDIFFVNNSTRELQFTGDLERYDDFSTVCRMLEKVSSIKIKINNKTIFIEEKRK